MRIDVEEEKLRLEKEKEKYKVPTHHSSISKPPQQKFSPHMMPTKGGNMMSAPKDDDNPVAP
jgi:hypothetical protein